MQKYKKMSYRLPENIILDLEIIQLMKLTEDIKITQSEIIENALRYSLDIFEEELREFGKIGYNSEGFENMLEKEFILPLMLVNKLSFYSRELGISESLLVLASIVLICNEANY